MDGPIWQAWWALLGAGAVWKLSSRPREERMPERHAMVREQLRKRGIRDPRVLRAMLAVPRHAFVPPELAEDAHADGALPIGQGQTISQPYVVAAMTEALELTGTERVLEIGTGCGYQTAVLAELAREVWTVEVVPELQAEAMDRLAALGVRNVHACVADGWYGWQQAAPFDAILVAAAPAEAPPPLLEQLAPGGRLVLPVGEADQRLVRLRSTDQGVVEEPLFPVRFVPLVRGGDR